MAPPPGGAGAGLGPPRPRRIGAARLAEAGGPLLLYPAGAAAGQAGVLLDVAPGGELRGGAGRADGQRRGGGGGRRRGAAGERGGGARTGAGAGRLDWMPADFAGAVYPRRLLVLDAGAILRIARWGINRGTGSRCGWRGWRRYWARRGGWGRCGRRGQQ